MTIIKFLINLIKRKKNTPLTVNASASEVIYLYVPYREKDEAKRLGAKWDLIKKRWFIPISIDTNPFIKWLPYKLFNLRAPYFYLAQTYRQCFKCGKQTKINAVILPENFEELDYTENEITEDGYHKHKFVFEYKDYFAIASYIQDISALAYSEILKYTDNYVINYSATTNTRYLMSTCQNCGVVQGDNYSIVEFDCPFSPVEVEDFSKITFRKILIPIVLDASCSLGYNPIEHYLGKEYT